MAKAKIKTKTPEAVAEAQANHPTMKWFDIFEVEPDVKNFIEGTETKPVIIGYTLVKKLTPVFIEPTLAMGNGNIPGFNHHAIGNDHGSKGGLAKMYFLKDSYKRGDYIKWMELARLIPLRRNHPYTQRLRQYEAWLQSSEFESGYENDEQEEPQRTFDEE